MIGKFLVFLLLPTLYLLLNVLTALHLVYFEQIEEFNTFTIMFILDFERNEEVIDFTFLH